MDAAAAGTYSVGFRLSSPYGLTDGLHIANAAGTNLTGPIAVPDTGGYLRGSRTRPRAVTWASTRLARIR